MFSKQLLLNEEGYNTPKLCAKNYTLNWPESGFSVVHFWHESYLDINDQNSFKSFVLFCFGFVFFFFYLKVNEK